MSLCCFGWGDAAHSGRGRGSSPAPEDWPGNRQRQTSTQTQDCGSKSHSSRRDESINQLAQMRLKLYSSTAQTRVKSDTTHVAFRTFSCHSNRFRCGGRSYRVLWASRDFLLHSSLHLLNHMVNQCVRGFIRRGSVSAGGLLRRACAAAQKKVSSIPGHSRFYTLTSGLPTKIGWMASRLFFFCFVFS